MPSDGGRSPVDAGSADAGPPVDGGSVAQGTPIEATAGMWTWVPFDDARCGNGDSTGIGVNLSSTSNDVFIFLDGGGACWNQQTCYVFSLANNLSSGFQEADFFDRATDLSVSYWDRADAENPLREWNYVYVPYCTGDVHAGDNIANHGGRETHHVGHANVMAYLDRLVPTFSDANRIILAGSSAGGYGAAFNFAHVQAAFTNARVDLIDDSGPLVPVSASLEMQWVSAWDYPNNFPDECTACGMALSDGLTFGFERMGEARAALFSYGRDGVISFFLGYPPAELEQALFTLKTTAYDPFPNARVFYTPGTSHTMLNDPRRPVQDGQSTWSWLNAMLADEPTWTDVVY